MLKTPILHPELLATLAKCGHKAKILVADANYSFETNSGDTATIVYLNFKPGMIASTEVVSSLTQLINVESATMMQWPSDFDNTIYNEYIDLLPNSTTIDRVERADFYNQVRSKETLLVIATGETRRFANLLLTVGPVFN